MKRALVHLLLFLGAALFMSPLYAMVVMALKSREDIASSGAWSLPARPTLQNVSEVLSNQDLSFSRLFLNSFTVASLATAGTVLTASMAAYAFARMRFASRDRLFALLLATMMLPGIITVIPSYMLFAALGWVNTQLPLWVPAWFGGAAFSVFLLRQFFLGIPRELDEAARLDGAGHRTIFWRVLMPLSGPVLATVAIFTFVASWTDFMGPLIYINDRELMTLELGLRAFQSVRGTQWHLLMAASLITLVPILVIFLAGQRYFVRGIALTGGK